MQWKIPICDSEKPGNWRTQEQMLMTIQEELRPLPMNGNAHEIATPTKTAPRDPSAFASNAGGAAQQRLD
jgi:hypothetical protein